MSSPEGEYYTEERWQNWIERLTSEEIDLEEEDSGRLLQNFQDDTVIAIAKIVTDYSDGEIDEDTALSELTDVRDIVLADIELEDENTLMLVNAVQTALVCVFYAAEEYIVNEVPETGIEQFIDAALDAEAEEDYETALGYCAQAGARILDGEELPPSVGDKIDYGPVADWVTGLRSLQMALADPEVVEADEE
jgi:hypothetical protein